MATTKKDPVLVILQLTGANDYLNTIVPYTNPLYWDNRPKVNIPEDQVLPIDDELAFRSDTEQLKAIYDNGNMAIIHGIGFENSPPGSQGRQAESTQRRSTGVPTNVTSESVSRRH